MISAIEEGLSIYKKAIKKYIENGKPGEKFQSVRSIENFLEETTRKIQTNVHWTMSGVVMMETAQLKGMEIALDLSGEEICNIWNEGL